MTDPTDAPLRDAYQRYQMRGVVVPWFTAESWVRLRQVADDRPTLDDTFAEFERRAGSRFDALVAAGHPLEKLVLSVDDVDRLAAWCRRSGRPLDGEARSAYAAMTMARRDQHAGTA